MKTIVVVQREPETREAYAAALRAEGYQVHTCAGPEPPNFDCPVLKFCGCIECEQSDAMVYDPCLTAHGAHPASERIIYRLREWYPEKPVLVVDRCGLQESLRRLAAEDPGVRIAAIGHPSELARSLGEMLG